MSDMTPPPAPPAPPMPPMQPPMAPPMPMGGPSSNSKLVALLGWIFAPLGIIAIFLDDFKNDMFVRSHVIQGAAVSIALWIVGWIVIAVTFGIAGLFWWVIQLGVQIYFGIQAYNGKMVEVPVVYGLVKSMIAGS
jgi:uncharacterized membrane protein